MYSITLRTPASLCGALIALGLAGVLPTAQAQSRRR
jgi:hypothetical protein